MPAGILNFSTTQPTTILPTPLTLVTLRSATAVEAGVAALYFTFQKFKFPNRNISHSSRCTRKTRARVDFETNTAQPANITLNSSTM